jgi:hypothetical protein
MENPASDVVDSCAEPLGLSPPTNSTLDRLSSGLCRGGLVLFVVSLLLPALYVRPTPGVGWGGTFPGYVCLAVSFVSFPCWVPNVLTIAAPFICTFARKKAKKAAGVVLALTALSVLQAILWERADTRGSGQELLAGFWVWALALITTTAGLAVAGVLGCLPFAFMRAGPDVTLIAGFLLKFISFSLLATAPLVCTFCGPVASRIVGALLALQVVGIMLSMRMMIHGKYQFWNLIVAIVLSAAGLLSMEVWQGKKASVVPEAGQPKVPLADHSLE